MTVRQQLAALSCIATEMPRYGPVQMTAETGYFLPKWIYVCHSDDGAIALDLRSNRYLGLDQQATALLRAIAKRQAIAAECSSVLPALIERGIITNDPALAKECDDVAVATPEQSLLEFDFDDPPEYRLGHLANFLIECLKVRWLLRFGSLETTLDRLKSRKARVAHRRTQTDIQSIRHLVKVFKYLRPLVYPTRENCLYDSLVLANFLARYDIVSLCVVGVKTLPFEAHCWVQTADNSVANGTPEFVARYTPILAA